jgi:DNA-binding NtrC family response regulator
MGTIEMVDTLHGEDKNMVNFDNTTNFEATNEVDEVMAATEAGDASSVVFTPGTKLREIERIVILETLKQKSFNRTHTARALGIGIRTLQRKLKRYGASDWGLKNWRMS